MGFTAFPIVKKLPEKKQYGPPCVEVYPYDLYDVVTIAAKHALRSFGVCVSESAAAGEMTAAISYSLALPKNADLYTPKSAYMATTLRTVLYHLAASKWPRTLVAHVSVGKVRREGILTLGDLMAPVTAATHVMLVLLLEERSFAAEAASPSTTPSPPPLLEGIDRQGAVSPLEEPLFEAPVAHPSEYENPHLPNPVDNFFSPTFKWREPDPVDPAKIE